MARHHRRSAHLAPIPPRRKKNPPAMASMSPETRRNMQRRDSSTCSSKRRPRLLRASATEPSINTSNVSRGALANPQATRRATDLLNQVAFVSSSSSDSLYRGSSPPSTQGPLYERLERERAEVLSSSPTSHCGSIDETRPYPSSRYFSFPSFDTWDPQEKEDEAEVKSP